MLQFFLLFLENTNTDQRGQRTQTGTSLAEKLMRSVGTEKVGTGGTGITTTEKSHETSRGKTETNQEDETNSLLVVIKSPKNVTASPRIGLRGHGIEVKG